MRILITGGYGFIGSSVCERFFKEGHQVFVIDNLSTGKNVNVSFPHKFYQVNIEDRKCEELFKSGKFDVVVHLAAQIDVETSVNQPYKDTKSNMLGLVNMLNCAQKYGVKKFIFASSAAVYGSNTNLPLSEDETCTPLSPYGINKYMGEFYCSNWQKLYGLNTLCFRFSNVYGPRQRSIGEGGVISKYIQRICKGEKLLVYGNGEQTRDFIYVEDVADAIYRSSYTDLTGIYNLSTHTEISINQLIEVLGNISPIREVEYVEKRDGDIDRSSLDNTRLKKELDWVPLHSIDEGLAKTYRWFKEIDVSSIHKVHKTRRKFQIIQEARPYIENMLAYLVVVVLTLSKISFLQNLLMDYNIVYILLIGVVYGTRQSLISVMLSMALVIYTNMNNGREIVSLFYDSQFLFTIASYLFIGLIIGFTTDKRKQEQELMNNQLQSLKEKHDFLYEIYHDTLKVKEELQEQIIRNRDGVGRIYTVIRDLESLEPEDVIQSSVSVLEDLMGSQDVSIYAISNNADLHLLIQSRNKSEFMFQSKKLSDYPALQQIVENQTVFVNHKLDPELPAMIAPIRFGTEVVALVTIQSMEFERLTIFYENLFKVSIELMTLALNRALNYVALTSERRYIDGTAILTEKVMRGILESKWKAKQKHHVTYEILKIEHTVLLMEQMAERINSFIDETDYMGMLNGNLVILLSNPTPIEVEMKIEQLQELGLYVLPLSDMDVKEGEGKIAYV